MSTANSLPPANTKFKILYNRKGISIESYIHMYKNKVH